MADVEVEMMDITPIPIQSPSSSSTSPEELKSEVIEDNQSSCLGGTAVSSVEFVERGKLDGLSSEEDMEVTENKENNSEATNSKEEEDGISKAGLQSAEVTSKLVNSEGGSFSGESKTTGETHVSLENGTEEHDLKLPSLPVITKQMQSCSSTPVMLLKKSNLKRPKCDTPESNSSVSTNPTPKKRIRIVENMYKIHQQMKRGENGEMETKEKSPQPEVTTVSEVKCCEETLTWLNSKSSFVDPSIVNAEFVRNSLTPVKRNFSVEIDMRFILTESVTSVLASKTSIANVGAADVQKWIGQNSAFNCSNFNFVYKENFLKMANIDALLNFDLTSPKMFTEEDCLAKGMDPLYYVGDLWYNSKGFREYLLTKSSQNPKQFSTKFITWKIDGIHTPLNSIDSKTGHLFGAESLRFPLDKEDLPHLAFETSEPYGGTDPPEFLDAEVLDDFTSFIKCRTKGTMLHLLVADNPEISYVYESCREIRFQKILYCQCLIALQCVREGGTFICKVFDTFTLFTNGLLFLLHKCFKRITMHKPTASSRFTSERFLICKGKVDNADSKYAVDFLIDCLDMVINNQKQMKIIRRRVKKRLTVVKMEVQKLIPLKLILSHAEFFQYVRRINIRLSGELCESVDQLCHFMENDEEAELTALAHSIKETTLSRLQYWNITNQAKLMFDQLQGSESECEKFLLDKQISKDILPKEEQVEMKDLSECASKLSESYIAFPIQATNASTIFKSTRGLFYGCSKSKILHYNGAHWCAINNPELSLPANTLLMGEIVEEIQVNEKVPKFVRSFHVFDGIFLCGVYIGRFKLEIRQNILRQFIKSVKNPSCSFNNNCDVIPCLSTIESLVDFYCKTNPIDHEKFGYTFYIRSYTDFSRHHKRLGLVGGFLLLKGDEYSSPVDFLKNYQHISFLRSSGPGQPPKLPEPDQKCESTSGPITT